MNKKVYPRVYGGTGGRPRLGQCNSGLSPRVRGNLRRRRRWTGCRWVYPRVYGGTYRWLFWLCCSIRSIPACTGEPSAHFLRAGFERVYPRVYGGTFLLVVRVGGQAGLSPRVRGNRVTITSVGSFVRSIPACTGEPICPFSSAAWKRVYPRVYGGTYQPEIPRLFLSGLSPRVRGNRLIQSRALGYERSIPACTGEPTMPCNSAGPKKVYPRVYGGTFGLCEDERADLSPLPFGVAPRASSIEGLSPRVRGNLRCWLMRFVHASGQDPLSPRVRGNLY